MSETLKEISSDKYAISFVNNFNIRSIIIEDHFIMPAYTQKILNIKNMTKNIIVCLNKEQRNVKI